MLQFSIVLKYNLLKHQSENISSVCDTISTVTCGENFGDKLHL